MISDPSRTHVWYGSGRERAGPNDLHPQLSPKEWRLNHPSDRIVLKTNPETQSDVLLLYHVLSHFGYPVELQELVPTSTW